MQTRKLGQTGLIASRACFGTMTFGSQVDQAEAKRIVDLCIDEGVNFFDTANVYNNGESERILGACIKGSRNKLILASKVRGKMADGLEGLSRPAMLRAIDESLQRLQTDYLDLYYLHAPDPATPIEETLATMDEIVKSGKVKYPAVSNFAGWQVVEAQWVAEKHGYTPATVSQPMYNLLARGIEQEYLPMCRKFGVATCIYNPLAGGLLTGKQQKDSPAQGTRFDGNQMYLDRYWHPAYFEAVDELKRAAAAHGRSLLGVALAWAYHHTEADCLILGASRAAQLSESFAALKQGPLDQGLLESCNLVWAKLKGVTPKYNR